MKHLKTILILLFITPFAKVSAQADSVQMGAGYSNDVYYSFQTGEVKKIANNTWDLGFRTGFRSDGIFINSVSTSSPATAVRSTRLFLYPKGDKSAWSSFDTTGWNNWLEYQNTDSSWEFGAFNRAVGSFPDFSWGVYNPVSKIIEGDSLYLLEINDGGNLIYKKLHVEDKDFGTWHFKYADVDGSNEVSDSIVASNANAKLLDYYSIVSGSKLDREPDSLKYWDIVFKRYHELIPPAYDTYYPVTGIWANKEVEVAQVEKVDINTFDHKTLVAGDYKTEANVLGSDWKYFDMNVFQWKLEDSLVYFVKARNGAIWRLEFTAFGGTANGKTVFNKTKVEPALSVNPVAPVASFGVYPNPASNNIEVVFENRTSTNNILKVYDMAGRVVLTKEVNSTEGFHANSINIAALKKGVYIVNLENKGQILSQKLIKE